MKSLTKKTKNQKTKNNNNKERRKRRGEESRGKEKKKEKSQYLKMVFKGIPHLALRVVKSYKFTEFSMFFLF